MRDRRAYPRCGGKPHKNQDTNCFLWHADGHACNVNDGTKKERHTCGCQKGGSVIRSHGEDVRVVLVERKRSKHVSTANGRLQ